ncbi:MAG: 2OG-Fe(II) oxygenase family protein [Woeseiaceae bacterium]
MPSTIELRQTDPVVGRVTDAVLCIRADELVGEVTEDLVTAVRKACKEQGFFYIDLSVAQQNSLSRTLYQMDRFFALQDDDPRKQATKQGQGDYGWVPSGSEPAYQPGTVSSLEAFDYGKDDLANPDAHVWPPLPGFRSDLALCWQDYGDLGDAVLQVLALAAGLPSAWLSDRCDTRDLNTMRLLHYAAEPEMDCERNVGIAAHTDFECITLLYQDSAGLELLNTHGDWLDAPAQDGRLIVLLGDMLEHWTNGTFKASGHRVRNTPERRYSIVQFFAVNEEIEVAPLAPFITADTPAKFTAVKQAQHITDEVSRAMENARQSKTEL